MRSIPSSQTCEIKLCIDQLSKILPDEDESSGSDTDPKHCECVRCSAEVWLQYKAVFAHAAANGAVTIHAARKAAGAPWISHYL